MKHDCQKEDVLNILLAQQTEMRADIKSLLKFKWKSLGGFSVMTVLGVILGTLLSAIISR